MLEIMAVITKEKRQPCYCSKNRTVANGSGSSSENYEWKK